MLVKIKRIGLGKDINQFLIKNADSCSFIEALFASNFSRYSSVIYYVEGS